MRGPFRNSDFGRLFAGRVVTNVGDSLYFVAAMWLVYDLTNDPFYSGVAGFLTLAPSALQFLAGPLVDRWSIRATLTMTQVIQAIIVLAVPVASEMGALTPELILVVMPTLSVLNQLVYPAQSAALPRLLDDEDLVAANSAFSVAYQGVDMVANALGGVTIALIGGVALFAIDAVTFGVAAILFVTVSVPAASEHAGDYETPNADGTTNDTAVGDGVMAADSRESTQGVDSNTDSRSNSDGELRVDDSSQYVVDLLAGGRVVRGTFLVWLIIGAMAVNFTSGIALATMPAYADLLSGESVPAVLGDAGAYGVLMGAFAAGNFVGAVAAGAVADRRMGRLMIAGFGVSGVTWTAAILANWLPVTAALLIVALVPAGIVNVQLAAVVQSAVPEELVGRVSSVLGSATAASIPVGALVGGVVASALGPETTMLLNGVGLGGLAVYVLAVPSLRQLPVAETVRIRRGSS
jgi:MFS family permease